MRIRVAIVVSLACLMVLVSACGGGAAQQPGQTPANTQGGTGEPAAPSTEATTYPPGPKDISGMSAWLEEAFPGAEWLDRIEKVEHVPGEVPASGGFANAIVVTTDLDFASEQPVGNEIRDAIAEAHVAWAKQYVIKYADGKSISAGDIVDMTP